MTMIRQEQQAVYGAALIDDGLPALGGLWTLLYLSGRYQRPKGKNSGQLNLIKLATRAG